MKPTTVLLLLLLVPGSSALTTDAPGVVWTDDYYVVLEAASPMRNLTFSVDGAVVHESDPNATVAAILVPVTGTGHFAYRAEAEVAGIVENATGYVQTVPISALQGVLTQAYADEGVALRALMGQANATAGKAVDAANAARAAAQAIHVPRDYAKQADLLALRGNTTALQETMEEGQVELQGDVAGVAKGLWPAAALMLLVGLGLAVAGFWAYNRTRAASATVQRGLVLMAAMAHKMGVTPEDARAVAASTGGSHVLLDSMDAEPVEATKKEAEEDE